MASKRGALLATVLAGWFSCTSSAFVVPMSISAPSPLAATTRIGGANKGGRILGVRPRPLPRLYSSPEPPVGGRRDFVDAFGGEKELTVEEKVEALRQEVQAQVSVADEQDQNMPPEEAIVDEKELDPEEVASRGYQTDPDFVDEGKNIQWPNSRRVAQLTVLAVVAQIAFVVYIITLNSILNSTPIWFGKLVEAIKTSNLPVSKLTDL